MVKKHRAFVRKEVADFDENIVTRASTILPCIWASLCSTAPRCWSLDACAASLLLTCFVLGGWRESKSE